jgi:hypothetical protein
MKLIRKAGDTSNIEQVFIQDSSSTTGAGLAGLTSSSSGLTAYYHRDTDTTATAITLATMTVGTFTSSGFKEIDATNMPGWYQFCPPDAALASGAKSVAIHLKGATNMAPLPIEIQLIAVDLQDATRAGLTALPNVAAGANGGLPTGDASGHVTFANTSIATVTTLTNLPSIPANWLTATGIAASALNGKGDWNVGKTGYSLTQAFPTNFSAIGISAGGHISNVDTVTTYTGNTPQTGDSFTRLGAPAGASVSADIAAVKSETDTILADVNTGSGAIYTVVTGVKAKTDSLTFTIPNVVDSNVVDWKGSAAPDMPANFASLAIDSGGKVTFGNTVTVKKNTALNAFEFVMTDSTNHVPTPGLTVTATRSIDAGAFTACANGVTEIGSGVYYINLATTDLNGNVIMLKFSAAGADDLFIMIVTQP